MKKAQAAMEFLMTYGWAILIVFLVFGALFFFGIIDLKSKLPEQVMFPPPLNAHDFTMDSSGKINVKLTNNLIDPIIINDAGYSGSDECTAITDFSHTSGVVGPTAEFVISFTCPDAAGKRIRTYLTFKYNNTVSGVNHVHTGYLVVNGE